MCNQDNKQIPVKQRPILFSTDMVRAILNRRKTMTRRVIKAELDDRGLRWCNPKTGWEDWHGNPVRCPYGQAGNILWVRETFYQGYLLNENDAVPEDAPLQYWYFADTKDARPGDMSDTRCYHLWGEDKTLWPKWKPPIHMPKEAARIFLRITDIRVERLQDISEEDAIAEGIKKVSNHNQWYNYLHPQNAVPAQMWVRGAIHSFETLWQKINGDNSWIANPWVWVVSFERVKKPK